MDTNNKIAFGALIISIISMVVTATAIVVGGTRDLSNIKDLLGGPGESNGLYAIVDNVKHDAESAKLTADHAKTVSDEFRSISNEASRAATEAKASASIILDGFDALKERIANTDKTSAQAFEAANVALNSTKENLPVGAIIPWNPTYRDKNGVTQLRNLPEGWAVCNGVNGTPNLTDRFLMGVAETTQSGKFAGSNTIAPAGDHTHQYSIVKGGGSRNSSGFQSQGSECETAVHNTGPSGNHSHGDNRPAYYTVVFILKIK
jgi:hypothetical protein